MIPFLLLVWLIVQVVPQSESSLPEINWERCAIDAKCYVEGKCDNKKDTVAEYYSLVQVSASNLPKKCNIGVQLIPITTKKVLIYMQVIREELKNYTIGLYKEGSPIVGCVMKDDGKVEVFQASGMTKKNKPVLYEKFSHFEKNHAMCAVTIDRYNKYFIDVILKNINTLTTILKFYPINDLPRPVIAGILPTGQFGNNFDMGQTLFTVEKSNVLMCDTSRIKPKITRDKFHVRQLRDPVRRESFCDYKKEEADLSYDYKLFIQQGENHTTEADSLFCDYNNNREFKGKTKGTDNTETVTNIDQSDFSVYCAVEVTKTCKSPLPCTSRVPKEDTCPTFTPGSNTADATLRCEDGKWGIAGEYYKNIQPECKEDDIENSASFYITLNGTVTKVTEGQCYKHFDCRVRSKVENSEKLNITEKNIFCPRDYLLRVKNGNVTYNYTGYTCHEDDGKWKNGTFEMPPNSRVMCEPIPIPPAAQETTVTSAALIVTGAVGGTFLVLVIILILLLRYQKRRYEPKEAGDRREWIKLSRERKIQTAANTFQRASVDKITILMGLELIAKMLNAETEDPEIWELAYPFLNRFHGSSRRMGTKLTGLFTRYLFVEAKKIIDKHGWKSTKPITKGNPKGYIRTIAIRLIYYFRFNTMYSKEITQFVAEGFSQLRFDGVEQYPHCGALWQHVGTSRNKVIRKRFLKEMETISRNAKDLAFADRFDDIGTVRHQAEEALGASIYWADLRNCQCEPYLTWPYLRGALRTSQLDMGAVIRRLFAHNVKGGPDDDPKDLAINTRYEILLKLIKKENMNEFLDKVMPLFASYGQMHAAKQLEKVWLYYPANGKEMDTKPNTDRYNQIIKDQSLFELALHEESEVLMEWLGRRQTVPYTKPLKAKRVKRSKRVKQSDESVEDTNSKLLSKSGKTSKSIAETASKVDPATDELFTALLKEAPTPKERIRACTATEEELTRYRAILAEIFHQDTIIAARVNFAPDDVLEIATKMKEIVATEPMLIEDIPGGVTVVGDVHGQLYDLHRIFLAHSVDGKPGYDCAKFVFLGDYVDRGFMALEVLMALFILKIIYPDRFFILRGNHEFQNINCGYGFMTQMYARYEQDAAEYLYAFINECFAYISMAGVIGNKFFCAHAGISVGSFTRQEFHKLEKPVSSYTDDPLLQDVCWADPAIKFKGICHNGPRGTSIIFGEEEFLQAMDNIGCEGMFRGHQVILDGQAVIWGRVICIFSQTAQQNGANQGAFAMVDEELKVTIRVMETDTNRFNVAQELKKQRLKKQKEDKEAGKKLEYLEEERDFAEDPNDHDDEPTVDEKEKEE